MKESKKKHMALRSVLFVALGILLLPNVAGQEPPLNDGDDCLFYAYSESFNHYFLVKNNSILYGDTMKVVHNCNELTILETGQFLASSNNSFEVGLDLGLNNFTFIANNNSFNYTVEVIPDRLTWEFEYEELVSKKEEFISIDVSNLRTNYAVAFGIVMVWVLTTYVYWRLIQSYVNKNFIEEVTG